MNKKDVKAMIESVLHGMQKETAAAVEAKSQNATIYQSLIADLAAYTKTKEKPKTAPPGFSVEALLKKHASDK
jgi:ethanolamine ammonia-lyase small subunit